MPQRVLGKRNSALQKYLAISDPLVACDLKLHVRGLSLLSIEYSTHTTDWWFSYSKNTKELQYFFKWKVFLHD